MAAFKGSLIVLERGDGASPEVFAELAGSRSITVDLGNQEIEVTTAEDVDASGVTWRTYITGMVDFQISMSDGIIKNDAAFKAILDDALAGTVRNYRLLIGSGNYMTGPGVLTSTGISGSFDGAAGYSLNVRASGAWTVTAGAPA